MEQAELNALEAQAAQVDAESNPAIDQAAPQVQLTPQNDALAGEFVVYMNMILGILSPALPSLKALYTQPVVEGVAAATATVCHKHGWLQDGIGGRYAEEIALAAIVIPLGFATHQAVKGDIAALKAKKEAQEKPQVEVAA